MSLTKVYGKYVHIDIHTFIDKDEVLISGVQGRDKNSSDFGVGIDEEKF